MTTKNTSIAPVPGMTRRSALLLMGAVVLSARAQEKSRPACIVTPEQMEGPYFVDERIPLALALHLSAVNAGNCAPLAGAMVDIWHCDADGRYSDVADPHADTVGKKFLRGYQTTDANGAVRFLTIYPGWYPGRTVHIHFKVRGQHASGRAYEFTSQLYFDDAVSDRVLTQGPYARHGGRRQTNDNDGLFRHNGRQLILPLVENGAGYAGSFDIGLRM
jgi:protocatechuate 3,4-dioxygenase beta subunit